MEFLQTHTDNNMKTIWGNDIDASAANEKPDNDDDDNDNGDDNCDENENIEKKEKIADKIISDLQVCHNVISTL